MSTETLIQQELNEITQEVLDVGLTDITLTRVEVMGLLVRFYGTVINAVQYMVITPEEAQHMHMWIAHLLELDGGE